MSGKLSSALEFIGNLRRTEKGNVVGYCLRNNGSEPIAYVGFDFGPDAKTKRLSANSDSKRTEYIKPGERVFLTPYETAVLYSTPDIDGESKGGDLHVRVQFEEAHDIRLFVKTAAGKPVPSDQVRSVAIYDAKTKSLVPGVPEKFKAII